MFDIDEIPEWWAMCPNEKCSMAAACLRHQVWKNAPENITRWKCLLPNAWKDDQCEFFHKTEIVRMARGFRNYMARLRSRDARHDIRIGLTGYFGSKGSYYRYRDGERSISPKQQQEILDIIKRNGGDTQGVFDKYVDTYDFTTF